MRFVQLFAIAVLTVLLFAKGIVPAFTTIGTDFANYYTSSYILLHERGNIDKLYDAQWFSQGAAALGSPEGGVFQPFPPATALVMIPLTMFDMQTAKRIWTVVNVGILAAVVVVISRLGGLDYSLSSLLLLASGFALINNFYLGQIYLLMVLCLSLSIWYFRQEEDVLSGVFAGLFVPIKYFPLCLIVFFFLQKRWIVAASAVLTAFAVACISLITMGFEIHRSFFDSVLFHHLDGQMANPFSATYQSWNSLLRSLFVQDDVFNANPLVAWTPGFDYGRALIFIGLTVVLLWSLRRGRESETTISLQIAGLFSFALLVAPATATYHVLLLSIPMAMVSSQFLGKKQPLLPSILFLTYVGMGAIPAGALDGLHLEGAWKLLAYPRLYFLTAFFSVVTLLMKSSWSNENLSRTL